MVDELQYCLRSAGDGVMIGVHLLQPSDQRKHALKYSRSWNTGEKNRLHLDEYYLDDDYLPFSLLFFSTLFLMVSACPLMFAWITSQAREMVFFSPTPFGCVGSGGEFQHSELELALLSSSVSSKWTSLSPTPEPKADPTHQ